MRVLNTQITRTVFVLYFMVLRAVKLKHTFTINIKQSDVLIKSKIITLLFGALYHFSRKHLHF